jgi:hypothetical protein
MFFIGESMMSSGGTGRSRSAAVLCIARAKLILRARLGNLWVNLDLGA